MELHANCRSARAIQGQERIAQQWLAHFQKDVDRAVQTVERALELYQSLLESAPHEGDESILSRARRRIEAEWTLLSNLAQAASRALEPSPEEPATRS